MARPIVVNGQVLAPREALEYLKSGRDSRR